MMQALKNSVEFMRILRYFVVSRNQPVLLPFAADCDRISVYLNSIFTIGRIKNGWKK